MSGFKDHFSSASDNYKTYRPNYPTELFRWLADQCQQKQRVWDCGTGSGQAAVEHSRYFDQVIASDASAAQIEQAQSKKNITYLVNPAETLPGGQSNFDLITVAQAIHWFDLPQFFSTVDKGLKPGGHLATWGYQFINTGTEIDTLISEFHSTIIGPYWPPERKLLNDGYTDISFPYPRLEVPDFSMEAAWSLNHLIGYLNTWSAVKKYEEIKGSNPIDLIVEELNDLWGAEKSRAVFWPLTLYFGQKPQ
ncbi:hypothetical protein A9Q99_11005 [Gammaproteobacteria bacterium 45_16_T64]|nr:hypothetical protein A9Q99_11005 [Gammaproteobacteria bacterium 45_16_T64]